MRPADDDDNNNGPNNNSNNSSSNNHNNASSSNFLDADVESGSSSKLSSAQTKTAEFSIWVPSTWLNFLNVIKVFRQRGHQQRKRQWQVKIQVFYFYFCYY